MLAKTMRSTALALVLLLVAACGGGGGSSSSGSEGGGAEQTSGPIEIWYSNNAQEIEWAQAQVEAWNDEHPDQQVTAQEIPAGDTSEEVITAAITAGNAPCLIYNTSPAAVPAFQRQGGLVALDEFDGAVDFVRERSGDIVDQYTSSDGKLYQLPWKANPVMIIYNKELFEQAGLDPDDPPLATYDEFHETARQLVEDTDVRAAIYPAPTSQFFQSWFDFYPLFAAETGGTQLVEDGQAQFAGDAGIAVAEFWRSLYDDGLAPREEAQGDSFAEGVTAMNTAGPWAVSVYTDIDWGVVPPPTSEGTPPDETWTFSDVKSVGLYTACENQATAWEFLEFTMSEEADRALLETTGQMPVRTDLTDTFSDFFEENPQYEVFADQASRIVEVPVVPNSIEVWQTFRDAWTGAVIFGDNDIQPALQGAADEIDPLVGEEG